MSALQSEVFEAFVSMGVDQDKALKAATALSKRDDDVVQVKTELAVMKWMLGFNTAMVLALFIKAFIH